MVYLSLHLDLFISFICQYIASIPEPHGVEFYQGIDKVYKLKLPFSAYFISVLEGYQGLFKEDTAKLQEVATNMSAPGTLSQRVKSQQLTRMQGMTESIIKDYHHLFSQYLMNIC